MISEKVEALLVPQFLKQVAGRGGSCISLDDLKRAVMSRSLDFQVPLLEPMFVEADFRKSGWLCSQELVAAVAGASRDWVVHGAGLVFSLRSFDL